MNIAEIAKELDALADTAGCLPPPSHRRPDAFHEARSELKANIKAIAQWLRTGRKPVDR